MNSINNLVENQCAEISKLKCEIKKLKKRIRYLNKYADIQADCLQFCYEFDQTTQAVKETLDKLGKLKS